MAHDRAEDIVASAVAKAEGIDVPKLLKERLTRQNAHVVELAGNRRLDIIRMKPDARSSRT